METYQIGDARHAPDVHDTDGGHYLVVDFQRGHDDPDALVRAGGRDPPDGGADLEYLLQDGSGIGVVHDGPVLDADAQVILALGADGEPWYLWDDKKKEVMYVKDQVALPLDKKIYVGKPASMSDLKKRTTIFRADGVDMRDDKEVTDFYIRIHKLRTLGGYRPFDVKGE